jgi:hypothetical protein
MCGIAGILSTHPLTEFEHHLCDLSRRLAHRGPDDRGYLQWNGTGPVHLGRQPIDLPDCRVGNRRISPTSAESLVQEIRAALQAGFPPEIPADLYGDGKAAEGIARILVSDGQ